MSASGCGYLPQDARHARFGLLKNDHAAVLSELVESLAFAKDAAARNVRFNFSIVM